MYTRLLKEFGHMNWWPAGRDFVPKEWEVCAGAILTQNTNWKNVEKALDNLKAAGIITPDATMKMRMEKLELLVRPSGFYRQKAVRLKALAELVSEFGNFDNFVKKVRREELLAVNGIGPETADSILLYACGRPVFVVDAYTRRFLETLGVKAARDYDSLRSYFEKRIPKDVALYREFHALIVEWGKAHGKTGKRNSFNGK
jgi:endonuclease-3 related protein